MYSGATEAENAQAWESDSDRVERRAVPIPLKLWYTNQLLCTKWQQKEEGKW